MLYLVKSGTVHEALESNEFGGEWVTPEGDDGYQGHFHLKSKKEEANGSIKSEGQDQVDKTGIGSMYSMNEKLDIHLLKKEGNRLKMLAAAPAGNKKTTTVAVTATTTTATASSNSNVRLSDEGSARSGTRPVQFLQWAINRIFRIRLVRWLRSVFWARAKIDG